jgi:aminomethyltransferase
MDVKDAAGAVVGHTTSGTFSPTLQTGIALALLDPSVSAGDDLTIDVRGRELAVTAQRPPFVAVSTK